MPLKLWWIILHFMILHGWFFGTLFKASTKLVNYIYLFRRWETFSTTKLLWERNEDIKGEGKRSIILKKSLFSFLGTSLSISKVFDGTVIPSGQTAAVAFLWYLQPKPIKCLSLDFLKIHDFSPKMSDG